MLLCGVDVGTSSIKVSVVDAANQQLIYSTSYPEIENEISAPELGFAEQDPEHWWYCVKQAILKANSTHTYNAKDIVSIGISYQMHGLVVIDKAYQVLRPSIIWCDSRSIQIGSDAYVGIGKSYCENNLLNSPGNFTASKLAWVKKHQPEIYDKIHLAMLPGDFIAGRFTNVFTTTNSALSEGIFWDFKANELSSQLMDYFGFDSSMIPEVHPVFSNHGVIAENVAQELGFNQQVKVTYKAGDQPNNAFSLGVLEPGEIATTAGTSGVVYGVSSELKFDPKNRVNSFAHVNYDAEKIRIGVLMCINGTGILNRWLKQNFFSGHSYQEMNELASQASIGSNGLLCNPFGNGAERIFNNKQIGASFQHVDFNRHQRAEIVRSAQEGIAFSMVYGIELLSLVGIKPNLLKAGKANMYLSPVFTETIVNASNVSVELVETDGAFGAALGGGVGLGYYNSTKEAVAKLKNIDTIAPNSKREETQTAYGSWKENLLKSI
jgi:xylulokinase